MPKKNKENHTLDASNGLPKLIFRNLQNTYIHQFEVQKQEKNLGCSCHHSLGFV
jgi:hypothetical protein